MDLCTNILDEFKDLGMEDAQKSTLKSEIAPFELPPTLGNPSRGQRQRANRRAKRQASASASARTLRRRIQRNPDLRAVHQNPERYSARAEDGGQSTFDESRRRHFNASRNARLPYFRGAERHIHGKDFSNRPGTMGLSTEDTMIGDFRRKGGSDTNTGFHLPRGMSLQEVCYTIELFMDNAFTADGSGVALLQASNSPAFAPQWASLAAPFEQYRVVEFAVKFEPLRVFGTAAYGPVATCIDRDDATALTGYSVAARFSSYRLHGGQEPWRVYARSTGINELGFVDCSTPVADLWIKAYSSGNTASATLGRILYSYVIVFKGLGLT